MKQRILLAFLVFSFLFGATQDFGPHINQPYCSHALLAQQALLKQKTIVQSPLLHNYDLHYVEMDLQIENDTTYLEGNVNLHAIVTAELLDTLVFELIDQMTIDSVFFDNELTNFIHENNEVFIFPQVAATNQQDIECRIFYHGTPPYSGFFTGVSTAYDSTWQKHVTWTLAEPFNAREWWPTKQILSDKIDSVKMLFTTSANNKVGSNGILLQVIPLPDDRVKYIWKSNYPIAYYLLSYAVAEYQDYSIYAKPTELAGDSVLILNYIYNSEGCFNHYKDRIDRTIPQIELFSDLYSLYPFYEEKYGHCLTMISGGMEHQTMTTLNNFGLGLVSHELGHMWFGDNVTCATWSDIWINEGFATYTDYLAHEMIAQQQWPHIWLEQVHAFVTSEPGGSIYVPEEDVAYDNVPRIFDARLTYYKGAMLLHQLRFTLNDDDLFFQFYKNFQATFKDSIATADDFLATVNSTTGQDFTYFFDQWFYGEGYPLYNLSWEQNGEEVTIVSNQSVSMPDVTPFFNIELPVQLIFDDETDTIIRINHTQPEAIVNIQSSAQVVEVVVDPELWVLKKITGINAINQQLAKTTLKVSPNPFSDKLIVSSEHEALESLSIFNLQGAIIYGQGLSDNQQTVDLSELENGVYLLKIRSEKQTFTTKIIKQN